MRPGSRDVGTCLGAVADKRGGWPALALVILLSLLFRLPRGGGVEPAQGDLPAYLSGAYHLRHDQTFSMAPTAAPVPPGLGREPGYPLFLAGLMALDPGFDRFTTACLAAKTPCPASIYRVPSLANLGLILGTGMLAFLLARLLCGTPTGGLIAAAYLLFNTHMNKLWADLMSDRLAVCLVALSMLLLATAWRRGGWRLAAAGAAFAALTLTKAIFLPFCLAAWCCAMAIALRRRQQRTRLVAMAAAFSVLVGGWALRNWSVSGMPRLTDARSGIALSTRAVFDDMSAPDYLVSMVYFSGSTGAHLAKRWFGAAEAEKFAIDTPGGYYDIGQNGYPKRVASIMDSQHMEYWQATATVDHQIIAGIKQHWPGYLVTMLPLTWRGLWIDQFLFLGLPCFLWACRCAVRRRDGLLAVLLGLGAYNMLAYAALSLNIQRYQMTAMPSVALAVAVTLAGRRQIPLDPEPHSAHKM